MRVLAAQDKPNTRAFSGRRWDSTKRRIAVRFSAMLPKVSSSPPR